MDGWMVGRCTKARNEGWMGGGMDEWMDGWVDKRMIAEGKDR